MEVDEKRQEVAHTIFNKYLKQAVSYIVGRVVFLSLKSSEWHILEIRKGLAYRMVYMIYIET